MKMILILSVVEIAMAGLLFILWHFRNVYAREFTQNPLRATVANDVTAAMPARALNGSRWQFINSWQVNPQADDRTPARVTAGQSGGSISGRRSTARRRHQATFKQWSQLRHE